MREIGVDTGATDCPIFTPFKQNKFIKKNHQWMILFIYYNLFLFATKWLCCTSRDWVVGKSFSGWWLITLLSCSIPRKATQPDKTSLSSQKPWTDTIIYFCQTQFQSFCKFSCHFHIPFFSTFFIALLFLQIFHKR